MSTHAVRLELVVSTPDGTATARLRGKSSVTVSLAPGYFTSTTPLRLADKVAELGELVWLARQDATGDDTRNSVVSAGRSADGSVSASTVGMTAWTVDLEPRAFMRGEAAFCAAAGEALSETLADRLPQLHRLALRRRCLTPGREVRPAS